MLIYLANFETQAEKDEFIYLYETYRDRMWYIAVKILHDDYDAEDVVHEAFVRISNNLEKLMGKPRNETGKLIVTIVKNISKDILRRKKHFEFVPIDETVLQDAGTTNDPIDFIISYEQYQSLKRHLSKLDDRYSSVICLKFELGYSNKEIAEILEIKEENVRLRLHRGRQELMAILRKEDESLV